MCKLNRTRRGRDAAAATMELTDDASSDSDEEVHLALYRVDGTMIPNKPIEVESGEDEPWTILKYLRTFKSFKTHGNAIKLAIGYSTKVNYLSLIRISFVYLRINIMLLSRTLQLALEQVLLKVCEENVATILCA